VVGGDPTLGNAGAGLVVHGRGASHQIDAIADFIVGQPFSHPHRLLVEAKFYGEDRLIGLPIIRGIVGVLKDVGEYWVQVDRTVPSSRRYHYQAAVFSASSFTADAQDYAFAHDIYLLPLRDSSFFSPILEAISAAVNQLEKDSAGRINGLEQGVVRRYVRARLQPELNLSTGPAPLRVDWLEGVFAATTAVGSALIGVLGRTFPVLLVPREGLDLRSVEDGERVEIHFRGSRGAQGWMVTRSRDRDPIFTFDLPNRLFTHFATDGVLSPQRALDLKAQYLREIQVIVAWPDQVRIVRLVLDVDWLARVRQAISHSAEPR